MKKILTYLLLVFGLAACGGGGGGSDTGFLTLKSVEITIPRTTFTAGERLTDLAAVGVYGDGGRRPVFVNWSVSDTSLASVNSGGFTALKAGTVDLIATEVFNKITGRITLTINPSSPTAIRIDGFETDKSDYSTVDSRKLTAYAVHPENASTPITASISWTSSNPGVATIDSTGRFTAVAPGTVTISAAALTFTTTKTVNIVQVDSNPLVIRCGPVPIPANMVSRAAWNQKYAADPQNGSEWVKFDAASCTQNVVGLYVKNEAQDNEYFVLVRGIRKDGVIQSSIVSRALTIADQNLAAGYESFAGSILFSVDNSFALSP